MCWMHIFLFIAAENVDQKKNIYREEHPTNLPVKLTYFIYLTLKKFIID